MATEEKSAWIMLFLAFVGYTVYLIWTLGQAAGAPLTEVPYVIPMLSTIGGAIVASMLLHMFFAPQLGKKDQRDRDISRFGEYQSFGFITIGALAALGMAMLRLDHFWIANAVYLCFVLSSIVGSIAKLVAYRSGLPRW